MNNVSRKCPRCFQTLMNEEYENHNCSIITYKTMEIGITHWFEGRMDENGDKVLIAHGLNGILMRLVECDHNPPHPITKPICYDSREEKFRLRRDGVVYDLREATDPLPNQGRFST